MVGQWKVIVGQGRWQTVCGTKVTQGYAKFIIRQQVLRTLGSRPSSNVRSVSFRLLGVQSSRVYRTNNIRIINVMSLIVFLLSKCFITFE